MQDLLMIDPSWIDNQGTLKGLNDGTITDFRLTSQRCNVIQSLEEIYRTLNPSGIWVGISCFKTDSWGRPRPH